MNINRQIKIGAWNIRGLVTDECHQLDDPRFLTAIAELDVLCLLETHHAPGASLSLEGRHIAHRSKPKHPRAKRHSGGMVLITKDFLEEHLQILLFTHDLCHVRIKPGK